MEPREYRARQIVKHSPDAPHLGVGLAVRKESPVEFWISMMQMIPPLNVKMGYLIQKGANAQRVEAFADLRAAMRAALTPEEQEAGVEVCEPCGGSGKVRIVDRGKLGAAARNAILQQALADGTPYVLFFDDDVLFPDMTAYRFWVTAQKHPEAAAITGIYTTKVTPCEPLLYADAEGGAYWDWPLGALIPIHSAGAGVQIVNMAYVAKLDPPWFNDVIRDTPGHVIGSYRRNTWGHDRYFHIRLRDEAGGVIYADTGVLCAHWDTETQRAFVIPPDAPCYQRPIEGECFVPHLNAEGSVEWRRLLGRDWSGDPKFWGYLDWLASQQPDVTEKQALVAR